MLRTAILYTATANFFRLSFSIFHFLRNRLFLVSIFSLARQPTRPCSSSAKKKIVLNGYSIAVMMCLQVSVCKFLIPSAKIFMNFVKKVNKLQKIETDFYIGIYYYYNLEP